MLETLRRKASPFHEHFCKREIAISLLSNDINSTGAINVFYIEKLIISKYKKKYFLFLAAKTFNGID